MGFARPNTPASSGNPSTPIGLTDDQIAALTVEEKLSRDWNENELQRALQTDASWLHPDPTKAFVLKRWILFGSDPVGKLTDALDMKDNENYGWGSKVYWRGLCTPFALEDDDIPGDALTGDKPFIAPTFSAANTASGPDPTKSQQSRKHDFQQRFENAAAIRKFFGLDEDYTPLKPAAETESDTSNIFPRPIPRADLVDWHAMIAAVQHIYPEGRPTTNLVVVTKEERAFMESDKCSWFMERIISYDIMKEALLKGNQQDKIIEIMLRDPGENHRARRVADPDTEAIIPTQQEFKDDAVKKGLI